MPIDLERLQQWTEQEVLAYFESGGTVVPDALPSAEELRSGALNFGPELFFCLNALGTVSPTLAGEEMAARRGCFKPKPEARVRLFALYGVADVAISLQPWIRAAPDWLEAQRATP